MNVFIPCMAFALLAAGWVLQGNAAAGAFIGVGMCALAYAITLLKPTP
jgi:hypothetical protein